MNVGMAAAEQLQQNINNNMAVKTQQSQPLNLARSLTYLL